MVYPRVRSSVNQVNPTWVLRNELFCQNESLCFVTFGPGIWIWTQSLLTKIRFSQTLSRMTTTIMTNLFLVIRAYFSFTYTYRKIPDCYDCTVDPVFQLFYFSSVHYSEMHFMCTWWRRSCKSLLSWTYRYMHCIVQFFIPNKQFIYCISAIFRIAGAWHNSFL